MKSFLRNSLIALMIAASITTFFTGCGKDKDKEVPTSTSSTQLQQFDPSIGDFGSADKTPAVSMYKHFWHDNDEVQKASSAKLKEAKEGATAVEGKSMLGDMFQVYADAEGNEFIISDCTRVYITEDGRIPAKDVATLRKEGTGERVYTRNSDIALTSALNALKDFTACCPEPQRGFDERNPIARMSEGDKKMIFESTAARINNMPAVDYTLSLNEGYISFTDLLSAMQELGYVKDYKMTSGEDSETGKETAVYSATVVTASTPFNVQIVADVETLEIISATTNDQKYEINQHKDDGVFSLAISLEDVEHFFGWDIEVYTDVNAGKPFINIVTDNKDVAVDSNFAVYDTTVVTTEDTKAEEQVDTTQDRAPTKDEAFESDVQAYMKFGLSREEAEQRVENALKRAEERQAKSREKSNQQRAEEQARHDEASRRMKEATGVSQEDLIAMSMDEQLEYMKKHPGVSFAISDYMPD